MRGLANSNEVLKNVSDRHERCEVSRTFTSPVSSAKTDNDRKVGRQDQRYVAQF